MNPDTSDSPTTPESQTAQDDHVERLLDLALEATFPASDALALPLGADGARTRPAELPLRAQYGYPILKLADVRAAHTTRVGSGSFRNAISTLNLMEI